MAAAIGTWFFSLEAVKIASNMLEKGIDCVAAVEASVNCIEDDPSTGVYYVGRGSFPNNKGIVQLDAGIMRGVDCTIGAVCALEGYARPISVARHLMENSVHNILVGEGAQSYATKNGFVLEDNKSLLPPSVPSLNNEASNKVQPLQSQQIHDTLSVLCLDINGQVAAGVSTSGPPHKLSGRVGDSPIPGSGYYADSNVGAAAATGDGEKLMKYCPSFHVVQLMRQGCNPREACEHVLKSMMSKEKEVFEAGLIAINVKGCTGASGTVKEWKDIRSGQIYDGFPYAVWVSGKNPVIETVGPCIIIP